MFFKIVSSSEKEIASFSQSFYYILYVNFPTKSFHQDYSSLEDGTEPPPLIFKSVIFIMHQ